MPLFTRHAKVVGITRARSTSQDGGGARKEHAGNGDGRGVGAVVVDVGPDQHLYQRLKLIQTPTPFAATLKRPLVPERVGRVRRAPCPPGFGIHQPDPWARVGPVGTAPRAHSELSDQTRQQRKAQTAPRTRGSK